MGFPCISRHGLFAGALIALLVIPGFNAKKHFIGSEEDRLEHIRKGKVQKRKWTPKDTSSFDFAAAPDVKYKRLKEGGVLECTFTELDEDDIGDPPGGRTPKFKCGIELVDHKGETRVKSLKVKYDPYHLYHSNPELYRVTKEKEWNGNSEVYGEVLATRLLASLGFYADRIYMFDTILCKNCPIEPWTYTRQFCGVLDFEDKAITKFAKPELLKSQAVGDASVMDRADLIVSPAVIEVKIGSEKLEYSSKTDSGFELVELLENIASDNGDGKEEGEQVRREAFLILASFLSHMDNKADQQRIVCHDKDLVVLEGGNFLCKDPVLMIQDAGSNFGGGLDPLKGSFTWNKLDLPEWLKLPVWKDANNCVISFHSMLGQKRELQVSDAGREYLARFMGKLTEEQIKTYFLASKVGLWKYTAYKKFGFLKWHWPPWKKTEMEQLSAVALGNDAEAASAAQDTIAQRWADGFMQKMTDQIINFQCGDMVRPKATEEEL